MNTWIHDFGNFKLVLDRYDSDISQQIKNFGWYKDEEFEIEIFRSRVKSAMTVVDLGANIGFYSIFARSLIGKTGRVFSFEPFAYNANLLRKSIEINQYDNVFLIESAVSNFIGKSVLHLSPDACSEHSLLDLDFGNSTANNSVSVSVTTLDDYFRTNISDSKVDFIKMDIEGSENNALKGMNNIINENKKISIITEFWPNGFIQANTDPKDFLETLQNFNFKLYNIDNLKHTISPVTVSQILSLIDHYAKNIPDDIVMKRWGWYTNILCERL